MHDFPCSRRDAIRLTAGFAVLPAIAARALGGTGAPQLRFVVVNDLHYRDARCGPWFEKMVAQIRAIRPAPAFCMLAGDLSESGTAAQLGPVKEIFRTLPMPVRTVIGNHDCTEDGGRRAYEDLFGKCPNARFAVGDWQFLSLDTVEGPKVYRTRIAPETLNWLDTTVPQLDRSRPVIVLTHFPMGRNWLRPVNAGELLARFKGQDLRAVLSGHWHGLTERLEGGAALSTGRCASWWRNNHDGSALKGFLICDVHAGVLSHRFVPLESPLPV